MRNLYTTLFLSLLSFYQFGFSGQWSIPQNLDSSPYITSPHIALHDDGDAIAIYTCSNEGSSCLKAITYQDGAWEAAPFLISSIGQNVGKSALAMNFSKEVVALWENTSARSIEAAFYEEPLFTEPTTLINQGINGSPLVVINNRKQALACFLHADSAESPMQVLCSFYQAGSWSSATRLSNPSTQASSHSIACNEKGQFIISWLESSLVNFSEKMIQMHFFDGSLWQTFSFPIYCADPGFSQVCLNNNGNAIFCWSGYDGNKQLMHGMFFDGKEWSKQTTLSSEDGSAYDFSLDFNDRDFAVASWRKNFCGEEYAEVCLYQDGNWSLPQRLSNAGFYTSIHAAISNGNRALVGWTLNRFDSAQNVVSTFQASFYNGEYFLNQGREQDNSSDLLAPSYHPNAMSMGLNGMGTALALCTTFGEDGTSHLVVSKNQFDPILLPPETVTLLKNETPRLFWQPSKSSCITCYRVYADGQYAGQIAADKWFIVDLSLYNLSEDCTYEVSAVNAEGYESAKVTANVIQN